MARDLPGYRAALAAAIPTFLVPRAYITNESWIRASGDTDRLSLGLFREDAPDLAAVLKNRSVLLLGEPGAGKSTASSAVVQHLLEHAPPTHLPIIASVKDYDGNLRTLLARSTPQEILTDQALTRTYVLDGIDEVAPTHRSHLLTDLNNLLADEQNASIILTARQAFYAHHAQTFPKNCTIYHLLDLDDKDIRAFARHFDVDPDAFIAAVREVDCQQEVRNPFVLTSMLERYRQQNQLSPLRSDNVGYVVDRLINSRPLFNAVQKRRALCMIAITCETTARNILTDDEARRVLIEAMAITPETADRLLDELSHSILVRTPGKISFQMRSYGEYLAAEELSDKSIERVRELAFIANEPVDTWLNTITYLAEMNEQLRQYFANNYPLWLLNISPQAFREHERTVLTRRLIGDMNAAQQYIVNQRLIPRGRLGRLLTNDILDDLRTQLASAHEHEQANALVLLGIRSDTTVIPRALRLATAHRNANSLRYSAIVTLINANDHTVLNDLVAFAAQTLQTGQNDPYHIHIVDAIGALCVPEDFPTVLPLLKVTHAGLSATFSHFRELRSRDALVAGLDYLTAHPGTLEDHNLDSYLAPILDLLAEHWDDDIAERIGVLLAAAERGQYYPRTGKLAQQLIRQTGTSDHQGRTIQTILRNLAGDGTRPRHINYLLRPLITEDAATWIINNTPQFVNDFAAWLTAGPARDILLPPTSPLRQAQDALRAEAAQQQEAEEQQAITIREQQQNTLGTSRDLNTILITASTLPPEHWPAITAEQREWLTTAVSAALEQLDLATSIQWISENQWTLPRALDPLLKITDHYTLQITNDVPLVLALRAWPDNAITKYASTHGLSPTARATLITLLNDTNSNITRNAISFLREAGIDDADLTPTLYAIIKDNQRDGYLRNDAINRVPVNDATIAILAPLAQDTNADVRSTAFRILIKAQHRPTISQAIGNLNDEALKTAETPFPESSPLDWIGDITTPLVHDELRALRRRTLALKLWRCTNLCTTAIANNDQRLAARMVRDQLANTPPEWKDHFQQEAAKLERTARINDAQTTPFDEVIKKLKGATSMISVKIWCEGSTDRPIFRRLLKDLGEDELARTIALVGGWGNLLAEKEPEHYLDGCKDAIIIMDGDNGRHLRKDNKPYTNQAKDVLRRFKGHRLKLYVLRRYGIENYFTQRACETVLGRDLKEYFPIPEHAKAEEHFSDPKPYWPRWINRFRKQKPATFYRKELNEEIAKHLTINDITGTDLATILNDIKQKADEARQY